MPKRSVPVQVTLNGEKVPEQIKQLVEQRSVDSVTYYRKEYDMKANYTIVYKKKDKSLHYTTYKIFIVD